MHADLDIYGEYKRDVAGEIATLKKQCTTNRPVPQKGIYGIVSQKNIRN
jgi:hypothetical protein